MDVDFDLFLENVRLFNKDNYTKKEEAKGEEVVATTTMNVDQQNHFPVY